MGFAEVLRFHADLPGRITAFEELLLDVARVGLVVPAILLAQPALEDEPCRGQVGILELLLDHPSRLLCLHSRRRVDEHRVDVLGDGEAVRPKLVRELFGVAPREVESFQQPPRAFLVGQLDANAPVVLCHG